MTPPLSASMESSLFFASLTLRICVLFLKGRSNIFTGFPYRLTRLMCSNFREISSQVQWRCVYYNFSWTFQSNSSSVLQGHGCAPRWAHPSGVSECTANASEVTSTLQSPWKESPQHCHNWTSPVCRGCSPENRVCEATKTSTEKDLHLPTLLHCLWTSTDRKPSYRNSHDPRK